MDKQLSRQIRDTVMMAILEAQEEFNERYLTADEVCKQFGMITKDWLARNGKYLPRERIIIASPDGSEVSTRWGYPAHKIARMLREGKLRVIHADK